MAERVFYGEVEIDADTSKAQAEVAALEKNVKKSLQRIDKEEAAANVKADVRQLKKDLKQAEAELKKWEQKRATASTTAEKRSTAQYLANARKKANAAKEVLEVNQKNLEVLQREAKELGFQERRQNKIEQATKKAAAAKERQARATEKAKAAVDDEAVAVAKLQQKYVELSRKRDKAQAKRSILNPKPVRQAIQLEEEGLDVQMRAIKHKLEARGKNVVNIDTRVSDKGGAFQRLSNSLRQASAHIGPFTFSLRALVIALSFAGNAVVSLVGYLGGLVAILSRGLIGSLGMAGAAALGLGLNLAGVAALAAKPVKAMAGFAKAAFNYGVAVSDAGKKSAEAKEAFKPLERMIKRSGSSGKSAARNIASIGSAFHKAQEEIKPTLWATFAEGAKTAAALAPTFMASWVKSTESVASGLQGMFKALRSRSGRNHLKNILGNTESTITPLMDGVTALGAHIGKTFSHFSDFLPDISKRFKDWAEGKNKMGDQRVSHGPNAGQGGGPTVREAGVDRLADNAEKVAEFFTAAGVAVKELVNAAVGPGAEGLEGITDALEEVARWARSPEAAKFFENARIGAEKLFKALGPIISLFVKWTNSMAPIWNAFLDGVTAVFGWLNKIGDQASFLSGVTWIDLTTWVLFTAMVLKVFRITRNLISLARGTMSLGSFLKDALIPGHGLWVRLKQIADQLRKIKNFKVGDLFEKVRVPNWLKGLGTTIKLKWGRKPPVPGWLKNLRSTIRLKWGNRPPLPRWLRNPLRGRITFGKFKLPPLPPFLSRLIKNPVLRFVVKWAFVLNVALLLKDVFDAGVKAKDEFVKSMDEGEGVGKALIDAARVFGDELIKAGDRFFMHFPSKLGRLLAEYNPFGDRFLDPGKHPPPLPRSAKPIPPPIQRGPAPGSTRNPIGTVTPALKPIQRTVSFVAKEVGPLWKTAKQKITKSVAFLAVQAGQLWKNAKAKITKAVAFLAVRAGALWKSAKEKITKAVAFLAVRAGQLWKNAKAKITKVVAFLAVRAGQLWKNAKAKITKAVAFLAVKAGRLWQNAKDKWKKVIDFLGEKAGNLWNTARDIWKKIVRFEGVKWGSLWQTAGETITKIVRFVGRGVGLAEGGVTTGRKVPRYASGGLHGDEERASSEIGGPTRGGKRSRPTFLVGEENRPEYIISTNPAYNRQNLKYWAAAGKALGIPSELLSATASIKNNSLTVGAGTQMTDAGEPMLHRGGGSRKKKESKHARARRIANSGTWYLSEKNAPDGSSGDYLTRRNTTREGGGAGRVHPRRVYEYVMNGIYVEGWDDLARKKRRRYAKGGVNFQGAFARGGVRGIPIGGRPQHHAKYYYGADPAFTGDRYSRATEYTRAHRGNSRARESWERWKDANEQAKLFERHYALANQRISNADTAMQTPGLSYTQFYAARAEKMENLNSAIRTVSKGIKYARRRSDWTRVAYLQGELGNLMSDKRSTRTAERVVPEVRSMLNDLERERLDAIQADIALEEAGQRKRYGGRYGGGDPRMAALVFWTKLLNDRRFRNDPALISQIAAEVTNFRGAADTQTSPAQIRDTARGELYREYGNNSRYIDRLGARASGGSAFAFHRNPVEAVSAAMAAGIGSSGGVAQSLSGNYGSYSGAGFGQAGPAGKTTTINQINNFPTPPSDPHTWSANTKFELDAMV